MNTWRLKMVPYKTFLQGVHKIALAKPKKESQRKFSGKKPHISFKENPRDYRGLGDKNYGTGFETSFIKPFNQFFCVLDIDDYKDSDYDILGAIPEEAMKTHQAKTQSGGLHLYFLSKEPLKFVQNKHVPLDLKAIRADSYNNGKYGGLIVGDYCWKQYNRPWGVDYVKRYYRHNNEPLLEIDFNNLVSVIYENLDLEVEKYKRKSFKPNKRRVELGNEKLRDLYPWVREYFNRHLNSKHNTAYRLNCRLQVLTDSEREILCGWLLEDFDDYMENIDNFINEFTKRK